MASNLLFPILINVPGSEVQNSSIAAAADTSTGQGNITSGLFLENKSGTAARGDAGTVETTVLGYCTGVTTGNQGPFVQGGWVATDVAATVDYIPDATFLANNYEIGFGEDGATTTVAAFIAAGNPIATGIYFGLINAIGSLTDNLGRVGVDASKQQVVQVISGASISATQGTLPFKIVRQYKSGKSVPDDPTATDTSAADWVAIRVNA